MDQSLKRIILLLVAALLIAGCQPLPGQTETYVPISTRMAAQTRAGSHPQYARRGQLRASRPGGDVRPGGDAGPIHPGGPGTHPDSLRHGQGVVRRTGRQPGR